MITDSQIGIQRPSKLRRAEQAPRSRLLGLVTDHYVAKLVALLFACVLVFLIDRELTISLIDAETFTVVEAAEVPPGTLPAGQRLISLQAESGVAIRSFDQKMVKVTIKGQQKLAEQLKSKALVGVVGIKKEWLSRDTQGSQTIDGNAINFGLTGATVTIEPSIHVDIDPEVSRDVKLSAAPKDVGPGLVAEVKFEPEQVKLVGPKSSLEGPGAIEQITITIPAAGRSSDFSIPLTLPAELVSARHVQIAPGEHPIARVKFSTQEQSFEIKDVPIRFLYNGREYDFAFIGLSREVANVRLSGTTDAVAAWEQRKDDLRKTLVAMIDTEKLLPKVAAQLTQPGSKADEFAPVEIMKIPDNLKVVSVIPAQVDVSVTKR